MTIPGHYFALARDWHILMAWPSPGPAVHVAGHARQPAFHPRYCHAATRMAPVAIWSDIRAHGRRRSRRGQVQFPAETCLRAGARGDPADDGVHRHPISRGWSCFGWLVDLLGGRQSARSLHFIFAFALAVFFVVHLILVMCRVLSAARYADRGHHPWASQLSGRGKRPSLRAAIRSQRERQGALGAAEKWHEPTTADRSHCAGARNPRSDFPFFRGNGSTDPQNGTTDMPRRFCQLAPRGARIGAQTAEPEPRQHQAPPPAYAGHAARLRRRLERDRRMDGAATLPAARRGRLAAECSLHPLPLCRQSQWTGLLRKRRPHRCLPPADDHRAQPQRRTAADPQRRAAAHAHHQLASTPSI